MSILNAPFRRCVQVMNARRSSSVCGSSDPLGFFSLAMLRWGYQGGVLTVGGKGTMEAGQVHS